MASTTINIRYDMPEKSWQQIAQLYSTMPGWLGFVVQGCPAWQVTDKQNQTIVASVEPSGLVFEYPESTKEVESWLALFCKRATECLGFEVRDAES